MNRLPDKILIATGNRGKVKEIRDLVADLPVDFLSLADVADPPEVIEDGDTFEANALKKARIMARTYGITTMADDSGLCVDALDGRPGVLSARYAGEDTSDEEKCVFLLEELKDVPDPERSARFVCVIALVSPEGEEKLFTGSCEGVITRELRGNSGFGYDPIFFYRGVGATFAEMDRSEKNSVSHRGEALAQFGGYLRGLAAAGREA